MSYAVCTPQQGLSHSSHPIAVLRTQFTPHSQVPHAVRAQSVKRLCSTAGPRKLFGPRSQVSHIVRAPLLRPAHGLHLIRTTFASRNQALRSIHFAATSCTQSVSTCGSYPVRTTLHSAARPPTLFLPRSQVSNVVHAPQQRPARCSLPISITFSPRSKASHEVRAPQPGLARGLFPIASILHAVQSL